MKKYRSLILSCIWIIICLCSLLSFSFAWLKREWRATISENQIEIQTGGSLAIIYNNESTNSVYLHDVVSIADFSLRQVSNFTGLTKDFFYLDFLSIDNPIIRHVENNKNLSYTELGYEYGYIEVRFLLSGRSGQAGVNQYVYLTDQSYLSVSGEQSPDVLNAIRISISVDDVSDSGTENITITKGIKYTNTPHEAITNQLTPEGDYFANNQSLYFLDEQNNKIYNQDIVASENDILEANRTFKSLDYYTSALVSASGFDENKALFKMQPYEEKLVTLRIWLEGQDPYCTDDISGDFFNLKLVLAGYTPQGE